MSDITNKLIDLSFVLVPAAVFVGIFFLMELKRKKEALNSEKFGNKKKLKP